MSTIRGVKDRRYKFVQLINEMFEDDKLSLKAKGFIGYCLTKPDTWKFHMQYLCSKLKEGEKAIYSVIDECEEQGYAIRYQRQREDGKFLEWETLISDSKTEIETIKKELENDFDFKVSFTDRRFRKAEEKFENKADLKKCLPDACFRDAEGEDAVNAPISNTEEKEVILKQQQQETGGAWKSLIFKNTKGEAVSVTQSEIFLHFTKLPYETKEIEAAIEQVRSSSDYIGNIFKYLEAICLRIHNSKSLKHKDLKTNVECDIVDKSNLPKVNLGQMIKLNKMVKNEAKQISR